jgi:hypothetical protein
VICIGENALKLTTFREVNGGMLVAWIGRKISTNLFLVHERRRFRGLMDPFFVRKGISSLDHVIELLSIAQIRIANNLPCFIAC